MARTILAANLKLRLRFQSCSGLHVLAPAGIDPWQEPNQETDPLRCEQADGEITKLSKPGFGL